MRPRTPPAASTAWLESEENMERWEDNTLTASDRRILLANWYYAAVMKAFKGESKRRYFEVSGALLTADGKWLFLRLL